MQPQVTGRRPCPWGSQVSNAGKPSGGGGGGGQRAGEAKGAGPGVGGHLRGGARAENLMGDHRQPPPHTKATNVWILFTHTHTHTIDTHAHRFINMHIKTQTPPKVSHTLHMCIPPHTLTNAYTHTQMCTAAPDSKAHRCPTAHTSQHPGPRHPPAWPCLLASLAQAALILVSCPEARR